MPFIIEKRDTPARCLLVTYQDPLTLQELQDSQEAIAAWLDTESETLHCILDMQKLNNAPEGVLVSFPQLLTHRALSHPLLGERFVVLGPSFVGTVASIYARLRQVLHTTHTLEEAFDLLRQKVQVTAE